MVWYVLCDCCVSDGKMEAVTTAQESYTGTMTARQGLSVPADKLRIGEAGVAFEVSDVDDDDDDVDDVDDD